MSHTLTRRNVSAIAKLDFAELSHAQRIDEVAKALGYETAAALMATLKSTENDAHEAAQKPIKVIAIFGEAMVRSVDECEPILEEDGSLMDGEIKELTFQTRGEIAAYSQGMADADGWMGHMIEADTEEHHFFQARVDNPGLSFQDWYTANQIRMHSEEMEYLEEASATGHPSA